MVQTQFPSGGAILDPAAVIWINLVKDYLAMLHPEFPASEPSGSEVEDFFNIFMDFCGSNLWPPGPGPSWILGPLFEQTWKRTTRQCYI